MTVAVFVNESGVSPSVHEGAAARPLVASAEVTVTVTGEFVFQLFEPVTVCVTLIDGFTVSILTLLSLAELLLPALSLTEQLTVCVP